MEGNAATIPFETGATVTPEPQHYRQAREKIKAFFDNYTPPAGEPSVLTVEEARRRQAECSPAVIKVGDARIATAGELSMVVGAAKSRKTLFVTKMVNAVLSGNDEVIKSDLQNPVVVYFDTEQGGYHSARSLLKIVEGLSDGQASRLTYYEQRGETVDGRLVHTVATIYEKKPDVAVIDGVADLMTDTNSIAESGALVGLLMSVAKDTNAHIVMVLHNTATNRGKAMGNVGSALERKCETVMAVEKLTDSTTTSEVKPKETRNEPFKTMLISHTADGGYLLEFYHPAPAPDDREICEAMMKQAKALFPEQQKYRRADLSKAHAAARKQLGGGDPVSETELNRQLKRFAEGGYLIVENGGGRGNALLYSTPNNNNDEGEDTESDGQ